VKKSVVNTASKKPVKLLSSPNVNFGKAATPADSMFAGVFDF